MGGFVATISPRRDSLPTDQWVRVLDDVAYLKPNTSQAKSQLEDPPRTNSRTVLQQT
jgi:hypothetical protein